MLLRYYIVDDFYNNPDQLLETTLKSVEGQTPDGNHVGVKTLPASMGKQQRDILQGATQEQSIDFSTDVIGEVTFSKALGLLEQSFHLDASNSGTWSGVVYLSKDHPIVDGTTFWKHRRTGLEEMPKTREELREQGWNSKEDAKHFLETDGVDESLWEKTFTVPFKYNRLVLYRPWMFHAPGSAFGDTLDNCRKVQTIFLGN